MAQENGKYTRDHERVGLSTRVDLVLEDHSSFVSELTCNISEGGMFVMTQDPWPEGTVFGFGLRPRRGIPPIRGTAQVVWTRQEEVPGKPMGMAARFVEIVEGGRETIRSLVVFVANSELDESGDNVEVFEATEAGEPAGAALASEQADVFLEGAPSTDVVLPEDLEEPEEATPVSPGSPPASRKSRLPIAVAAVVLVVLVAAFVYLRWTDTPMPWEPPSTAGESASRPVAEGEDPSREQGFFLAEEQARPVADVSALENAGTGPESAVPESGASVIQNVTWAEVNDETVVTIHANGEIQTEQVGFSKLEGPPRMVIRLSGIFQAYMDSALESSSPGLAGIRFGHHQELVPPELHVVLDLTDETTEAGAPEIFGKTLVVRLSSD